MWCWIDLRDHFYHYSLQKMAENININIESRSDEIKKLILNYSVSDPAVLNIDGLLDALIVLYDECSNPTMKGEKTIKEFVEYSNILFLFMLTSLIYCLL